MGKISVHAVRKPMAVQVVRENMVPRKILRYRKRILLLARPIGRVWKVV